MRGVARLAIACAAAIGCSVEPGAPAVTLEHDPLQGFDAVKLRWLPPARGDFTGYAIEVRVLPGPYETFVMAGPATTQLTYSLARLPELTDLEFRVRALPDEDGTRASAAMPFRRGIRAPMLACAPCSPADAFVQLSLANASAVADGFLVQRVIVAYPQVGAATLESFPLPIGATFLDSDIANLWLDGAEIEYRLFATKAGERSAPRSVALAPAPPFPSRIVSSELVGGKLAVTFENVSRSTSRFSLIRDLWTDREERSLASTYFARTGDTTVLVDGAPPGTPAFYCVRGYADGGSSDACFIWPAPTTDLVVSAHSPHPGSHAVRIGTGGFATANPTDSAGPRLFAPSGTMLELPHWLEPPGLALDPLGRPHAVYGRGSTTTPTSLEHAWWDGRVWRREELGAITAASPVAFDVGPDGTVHACWRASSAELRVARRSDAGWSFESVPAAVSAGTPRVSGDAAGGTHVLAGSGSGAVYLSRTPAGWTSEAAPAVAGGAVLLAHARGVSIVDVSAGAVRVVERTSAGWGPFEVVAPPYRWYFHAARSLDGRRIAVVASGKLWIRDAAATVDHAWTYAGGSYAVGFRPDGKAWVLAGIGLSYNDYWWRPMYRATAALYEEP